MKSNAEKIWHSIITAEMYNYTVDFWLIVFLFVHAFTVTVCENESLFPGHVVYKSRGLYWFNWTVGFLL